MSGKAKIGKVSKANEGLEIKLNEKEELSFSFHGSINEGFEEEPAVRFAIVASNGIAISFPAKISEGKVTVEIPPLEKFVVSELTYVGKLELIANNSYYSPIKLPINFTKSLKAEAKKKLEITEEALLSLFETLEIQEEKKPVQKANIAQPQQKRVAINHPKKANEPKTKPKGPSLKLV